jgi:hypothetical protein
MATTSADTRPLFEIDSRTTVHWVAVLLAAVTGAIHLLLGVRVMSFNATMGVLFVLAGLGFFGGIVVFLTRYWRRELYLVAAAFAGVQILAWLALGRFNALGYADKAVQVVFVLLVVYLYRESAP